MTGHWLGLGVALTLALSYDGALLGHSRALRVICHSAAVCDMSALLQVLGSSVDETQGSCPLGRHLRMRVVLGLFQHQDGLSILGLWGQGHQAQTSFCPLPVHGHGPVTLGLLPLCSQP